MKRAYVKPSMIGEQFAANEYCSSCGESGTTYKFYCTAGHRDYEDQYPYKLYDADGDLISSNFEPCYVEGDDEGYHEAESTDSFFLGYMDDKRTYEKERIPVYIWAERVRGGYSYHCTAEIDKDSWETAKS